MANKGIDYVLSLDATRFQRAMDSVAGKAKAAASAVVRYWLQSEQGASRAGDAFLSMQTKVVAAISAIGGVYAVKTTYDAVVNSALAADKASFGLASSIQAANREFKVGGSEQWRSSIKALTDELKIYSTTAVTEAAAKTIDMTKRLGLSEQQMLKVVRAAANLSAGRFELADGVERVTAALRGEAEASEALGLTLNETYVKSWYEARGATQGAWKDLTDLQKAQIRYNILLQQSDPLQGKAAKSANTYGGAMQMLAGNFDAAKAALGETVTRNSFFVEIIKRISEAIKAQVKDIDTNRGKWIEWGKQGALAALDFAAKGILAVDSLYRGYSGLVGGLQEVASTYYKVKAAALEWSAAVTLDKYGSAQFASDAAEAAKKADEFSAAAAKSFSEMDTGAPKIQAAAAAVQRYRDELSKIQAAEINMDDIAGNAKAVQQEIVQIGGKFVGVAKEIDGSNEKTSKAVASAWEEVWKDFESGAIASIEEAERRLQELIKERTATVKVRMVQENSTGGLIGGFKLGGIIQALASGGRVRNILRGGFLPGFGGGDRRLLYGEDGEVMLNKYAVRAGGLKAALAFNDGRFDVVIAELSRRMNARIGYHLGGMIGRFAALPVQGLAAGGAVSGGAEFGTINLAFAGGNSIPVQTTRDMARQLLREFDRMGWRASS